MKAITKQIKLIKKSNFQKRRKRTKGQIKIGNTKGVKLTSILRPIFCKKKYYTQRQLYALAVPKFVLANFGNFWTETSGIKCKNANIFIRLGTEKSCPRLG